MPNLRDLKDRISGVKSTRKITSAMKMVAASKLRKAQQQAEASQPYAVSMAHMLSRVAGNVLQSGTGPRLLTGTGMDRVHLFIVVTSDRGLCGGFNSNLARQVRQRVRALEDSGKKARLICVGRKGYDILKRDMEPLIIARFSDIGAGGSRVSFADAGKIASVVLEEFDKGAFDICTIVYNGFQSVLVQKPQFQKLIPFELPTNDNEEDKVQGPFSPYVYEPDEEAILRLLLPKNLSVQVFRALLDSAAGEQAARMTAMDNATRNAGDMISALTLQYNRERQAAITNELIEIISGAEAV